jgi:hypothetical protein
MTILSTVADGVRKVFSIPPYTGSPVVKVNGTPVSVLSYGDSLITLTAVPAAGASVEIDYTPVGGRRFVEASTDANGNLSALLDGNGNVATAMYCGGTTASEIQAAIDLAVLTGVKVVKLSPSHNFTYDGMITLNPFYVELDGQGATIFADDIGVNEKVITVDYDPPVAGGYRNLYADVRPITNLAIVNKVALYRYPGSTLVSGSVGIYINGSDSVAGCRPVFRNVMVSGFETLIDGKDRWYLSKFYDCTFHNFNIAVRQQAGTDAGENISYYGCTWTQGNLAFHLLDGSSEHFLFGCSVDYTNQLVVGQGSPNRLHLSQCHVEPRGVSVGGDPTSTSILLGNGSDPRAAVSGRDSFIDIDGNGSYFRMAGGWFDPNNTGGNGPYSYSNLVNLRSKSSLAVFDGVAMDNMWNTNNCFWTGLGNCIVENTQIKNDPSGANMPSRITDQARGNLLREGQFTTGSFPDLWYISTDTATVTNRLTGTNINITRPSGQNVMRLTKVASGAGRISCLVPIRKNCKISMFGEVLRPSSGNAAGDLFAELRWVNMQGLDSNGVPILGNPDGVTARTSVQLTNTTGAWTSFELKVTESTGTPGTMDDVAPSWATHVRVVINSQALGAGYVDFRNFWVSQW